MADGSGGVRWWLRLLLDPQSKRKVEEEVSGTANKAGSSMDRAAKQSQSVWLKAAKRIGAALAAAFTVRAILNFGRAAVREATEAERAWTRLDLALGNIGSSLASVRSEVDAAARAMQDATRFGDEDFAAGLEQLVTITGDYNRSLQHMGLVADLAAAKNMSLGEAAQIVGRILAGDTVQRLRRWGIIVGEGEDAIEALREQVGGLAEGEGNTLSVRLAQINNEWGDFKEAIGEAMVSAGDGKDALLEVRDALKDMVAAVNESPAAFRGAGITIATFIRGAASLIRWAERVELRHRKAQLAIANFFSMLGSDRHRRLAAQVEEHIRDIERSALRTDELLNDLGVGEGDGGGGGGGRGGPVETQEQINARIRSRIDLLGKARDLNILTGDNIQEIIRLEMETRSALEGQNLTLERQIELRERLATLEDLSQGLVGQMPEPEVGLEDSGAAAVNRSADAVRMALGAHEKLREELGLLREEYRDAFRDIEASVTNAAFGVAGAWQDAFGVLFEEGANVGDFMEALGRGVGGAFLGGLAEFASGKIAQNLAAAAEMFAFAAAGIAVPGLTNPAAAMSAAAGHLKAAGLWSVLAGAAGAGQAAVGGGGRGGLSGGVPTGARDIGGRIADRQHPPGPEIHIYVDGIDPDNARHQDLVGATTQKAQDRWGPNAKIRVHSNPRRRG